MDIGMIGLGRMGANRAERLRRGGHRVVGFDSKSTIPTTERQRGIAHAATLAAPVITLVLLARLRSRDTGSFSDKLLAALRHQFGGHEVRKE